jgi:hypothetical protein
MPVSSFKSGTLAGEKRHGQRDRVLFTGKAVLSTGLTIDCRIADLGPDGARLKVGPFDSLPDDFHLIVLVPGMAHHCVVRWRIEDWTGVEFKASWDLRKVTSGEAYHLRRIWLDR